MTTPLVRNGTHRSLFLIYISIAPLVGEFGCAAGARVELSAAQTLDALVRDVEVALAEYHAEVNAADRTRRTSAVDAFVTRIRTDNDDEAATANHVKAFHEALDRILADVRVETNRHTATMDNVGEIRDVATGLRRLAIESMSLNDELKRYVTDLINPVDQDAPAAPTNDQQGK
jgi:hypothetical protein